MSGECEYGKCEICGKETYLDRTYFYYPIHCECCGSVDSFGQKQHFVMVRHCNNCSPKIPNEIHPLIKGVDGKIYKTNITNILPSDVSGEYIYY